MSYALSSAEENPEENRMQKGKKRQAYSTQGQMMASHNTNWWPMMALLNSRTWLLIPEVKVSLVEQIYLQLQFCDTYYFNSILIL